jgi:hypothetical protein
MLDASLAIRITEVLSALAGLIGTLELLALKSHFTAGGLWDWRLLRVQDRWLVTSLLGRIIGAGLSNRALPFVLGIKILMCLMLLVGAPDALKSPATILLAIIWIIFALRLPYGADGTDQMLSFIFSALAIRSVFPDNGCLSEVCLWFIALQTSLCYCTAGVAKLRGDTWRRGTALPAILATTGYGHPHMALWLTRRHSIAHFACWAVIGFECAFPTWLLFGGYVGWPLVVTGLGFHLVNALIMGLNRFLWAFLATYPAVLFCAQRVHLPHLGWMGL